MDGLPHTLEDRQQLLLDTIDRYRNAESVEGKLRLFASIAKMADRGFVSACYVVGTCYVGEGPCGDGLLEIEREKGFSLPRTRP